jgi:signal transduction histidine kinase
MIEPVEPQMVVPRWQRLLLPSAMLEEPQARRSVRDWIVDLTMFALALGIGALVLQDTWSDHSDLQAVLDIVLGVTAAMSLWWRRSHPAAVGAFAGGLSLVSALANGAGVMAFFNAALRTSGRTLAALIGLALVNTIVFPLIYPGGDAYVAQLLVGLLITGVVVGWGLFVRVQRELVRSLRERAERLQAEQRLKVDQAREAERLRIAREMHDVLAHRISLIALHAGGLEVRPDLPPEQIRSTAALLGATARQALEELRGVIGVLRENGFGDAVPAVPQPTLRDIGHLVEETRIAGTDIDYDLDVADIEGVPATLGRDAYRIVQEGLTNVAKHAGDATARVRVVGSPGEALHVSVRNREGASASTVPTLPGSGTGLLGLRERVALSRGTIMLGPDGSGDFVVEAELAWHV